MSDTADRELVTHPGAARASLQQALEVSRRCLEAAEHGNVPALIDLDAQRLQLLKSARRGLSHIDAEHQALLQEISRLNDCAIGAVEHQHRAKAREMDMAATGRRALAAYSNTQLQR